MRMKVCNYFEMSMTVQLVHCPPALPLSPPACPHATHKYNRLKHSLTDYMTVCQSSVLGGYTA